MTQTRKAPWSAKMLATAAICIALSFLLSYLRLFKMPAGGSVTAASMLPVMLFSWLYGVVPGLLVGAAYGILQFIQSPEVTHWIQVIVDYPLAFMALGLAGLFRKSKASWALPAGIIVAVVGRFVCHLLTGMVFFGEYAPAQDIWSIFLYSAGYNGGYLAIEATILCTIVSAFPPVQSAIKRLETL